MRLFFVCLFFLGLAVSSSAAGGGVQPSARRTARIQLGQPLGTEATLDERLEAKATFELENATLKGFAEALEAGLDTPITLAKKNLEEAAVDLDTPMTYRLKNVRVKTALKLILGEMNLTYSTEDNVLVITTPEDAGSRLVTRVYDCCDLLALPSLTRHRSSLRGNSAEDLLDLIMTIVQPDSWFDGNNQPVAEVKGLLIISQTQEVHEDIEKLLNQLHKAAGIEEKVKVQK